MRKWIGSIGILATCFMLAGCHVNHDWQEATCTTPRICTVDGETEGDALGHTWVEATCTEPKTCSICGETEGEALGHALTEANYQQSPTCQVCGETIGEPLEADFAKYGLSCDVELNKVYDYTAMCYDNNNETTIMKSVFSNYRIFDSDDTHPAIEGYEWRTVDVVFAAMDENAKQYGWLIARCHEDYYDVKGRDDSANDDDNYVTHFTVNYNGIDYTECQAYETWYDNRFSNDAAIIPYTFHTLVPIGYDGSIIGFRNGQIEWEDGQHIYDLDNTNTLFFRLANLDDIMQTEMNNVNLSSEEAVWILNNFTDNIETYIQDYSASADEILSFFDFNNSGSIDSVNEFTALSFWTLDNYSDESHSLSEENAPDVALDYLSGDIDLPDTIYNPLEEENTYDISSNTENVIAVAEQSEQNEADTKTTQGSGNEVAFNGEPILKSGTAVTGYAVIQDDASRHNVIIDDCYTTSSGTYVVVGDYALRYFTGEGNGCKGQYVLWSLGNYGIPNYYDYTEYAPLLNVDYWKIN